MSEEATVSTASENNNISVTASSENVNYVNVTVENSTEQAYEAIQSALKAASSAESSAESAEEASENASLAKGYADQAAEYSKLIKNSTLVEGTDYLSPEHISDAYQTKLTAGTDYQTPLTAGTDYQIPLKEGTGISIADDGTISVSFTQAEGASF